MNVLVHVPGPCGHGVVRHADAVARLVAAHGVRRVERDAQLSHAQFTDALWGLDVATASAAFRRWAATAPRPLVVTLHDLPGADPDPIRDAARRAGYAQVAAAADLVVVSAEHEAAKVALLAGRRAEVIELPIELLPGGGRPPAWSDRPTLGVLGFVYPGKGHTEAIDAAARRGLRHGRPPRVVAAGAVSPGHAELHRQLRARAAKQGVELVLTGPLDDADLAAAADAVTVPLAPNRRVSASGSVMTWLGRGRRPLAASGEYTAELDRRHPGAVHLYRDDDALDAAVERALADPGHTRAAVAPPWPDVGAAHAALYRRLAG